MKTWALTLLTVIIAFQLSGQSCESIKSYFGADFGISIPGRIQHENYKTEGLTIRDFEMAIKGGIRIIPLNNCDKGLKYLIEAEIRSDNWQNFILEGTSVSLLGGTETWLGEKGYLNLLVGLSVPFVDSVSFENRIRPYAAFRIGLGQFYFQPVFIPRVNINSYRPTMIYLTVGFKNFSYTGVRHK